MMKTAINQLLLAVAMLMPGVVCAQSLALDRGVPEERVTAMALVGVNTSNLANNYSDAYPAIMWNHSQWNAGLNVGMGVDFHLLNCFAIRTGFDFHARGNGFQYLVNKQGIKAYAGTWDAFYLDIPLLMSLRFGPADEFMQLHLDLGPYLGLGMAGGGDYVIYQTKDDKTESTHAQKNFFGPDGIARSVDWGLRMGSGATFNQHYYFGAHYSLGLANLLRPEATAKEPLWGALRSWTFTAGYIF